MGKRLPVLRTITATAAGGLFALSAVGQAAAASEPPESTPSSSAEPRIVGGEQSSVSAYPFAVYLADEQGQQFCGGTLIAPDRVLTAAHCAEALPQDQLRVVGGRDDKQASDGHTASVAEVWTHPDFTRPNSGADIGVLTLNRSLPYRTMDAATDRDAELYAQGTEATVLGWGRTSEGGEESRYLRSATVPVLSDEDCAASYRDFDAESMVCAGYPEGGIDACQGDSGGPLIAGDRLIGIVSWGEGCARPGSPGVYTRVSNYQQEINDQLRG
ncbi:trypsin [Tamaricihabitans halophyticus]|uniref:Trypsin n=1 Tax=Tamaricihabitans halophyticus TaxID=1262583 RepID=A0A4R2QK33_9PSEU|nr:serine protease [Tamaricihabitans halophyticus]TCP49179.1 trypsin [Tamaricihabitans halophyticus]